MLTSIKILLLQVNMRLCQHTGAMAKPLYSLDMHGSRWISHGLGQDGSAMAWVKMDQPWLGSRWINHGLGQDGSAMAWVKTDQPWLGSRRISHGLGQDGSAMAWVKTDQPWLGSRRISHGLGQDGSAMAWVKTDHDQRREMFCCSIGHIDACIQARACVVMNYIFKQLWENISNYTNKLMF